MMIILCTGCCCNSTGEERKDSAQQPHRPVQPAHSHCRTVCAERTDPLPAPPLPLSTEIHHSYFALNCYVDFRCAQDTGTAFFRGGARYTPPLGCYRYGLAVLGRYPDGEDWLRSDGDIGEWQVAYHGTTCENVGGIVKNGFDLEKCRRFTASLADLANQFSSAPKRLPSTRADNGSKYIMFLFGVVAFCVFCCCMARNSVERERRLWTQQPQQQVHQQRAIQPYYRAVYTERIQPLPTPPLPLSTEIDHSSFALDCNVDFRREQYPRTSAFRGGARYSLPLGCYRYALSVLGKYPDGDDWLRSDGDVGEWQVAYHGTTCENVSGIIKNGFDLEKCQRFTYGKGIYCTPDPSVAKSYSVAYHVERRWYKAVIQVRVHPTLKRIAFNENKEEYWIIPYAEAIRPYGVCVYDVTR